MAVQNRNIAVGVFDSAHDARRAVEELHRLGFTDQEIGVASKTEGTAVAGSHEAEGSKAGEGALAGLATGAGVGGLWAIGIAAGFLPAIGPAIAGGILGSLLTSAAAGAAAAGLAGALIGLGIPEEEAEHYNEQFSSGKTIVTVRAANRFDEAQAVLSRFGGISRHSTMATPAAATSSAKASRTSAADMSTRATHTSASPTTGAACNTTSASMAGSAAHRKTEGNTVQLREEELHVDKTKVQTGEVHLRKDVVTEHKTIDVPVEREELVIERHAVSGNRPAGAIGENEEIHIPIREEQVNVTKQPVVREEVSVGKRVVKGTKHVDATVSKEELRVEKEGDVRERS